VSRELYSRGAFVGHWENNTLSNGEGIPLPATRIAGGSVDDRAAFKAGTTQIARMSTDDRFRVEESARLLRAIYPNYPDILG
jgi:hypothetical protein